MPVYTEKEYRDLVNKKKKTLSVKEGVPSIKKEKEIEYFYFLLHPENERDCRQTFQDSIKIKDRSYDYKCINGMVRTDKKELVDYLIGYGYHLVKKIEVKEIMKGINENLQKRNLGIFNGARNYGNL